MKPNFSSSLSIGFTSVREHPHNFDTEVKPNSNGLCWYSHHQRDGKRSAVAPYEKTNKIYHNECATSLGAIDMHDREN